MNKTNFERMQFDNMAIALQFFDPATSQNLRKVSATHAEYLTGGATIAGNVVEINPRAEFEAKTPIGYQIGDALGNNIQGDDSDPSGYASWEILTSALAQKTINAFPAHKLQLFAIYPDDIEDPEFLG